MNSKHTYQLYGERAILITWEALINSSILEDILLVKELILDNQVDEIQDISSAYNTLLVVYKHEVSSKSIVLLESLCASRKQKGIKNNPITWEVPVCYHASLATDLEQFAKEKKMQLEQLIKLHSAPTYTVYGKGFLPGFMYLGGLHKDLYCDRKESPVLKVPENSVAIGGQQTGIYPSESPGGWHVIGRTPAVLFDVAKKKLSKISVGDKLRFKSISLVKYIEMEVSKNKYKLIKKID